MEETRDSMLDHVSFLGRRFQKDDIQSVTILILLDLGIPSQRDGFERLKMAIINCCENPELNRMAMLYETVDAEAGYFAVDQSIRGVIKAGMNAGREKSWNYYFPVSEDGKWKRPSNAVFITRIARVVKLWQDCGEEVSCERV